MEKKQKTARAAFNAALTLFFTIVLFLPLLSRIAPIQPRLRLREQRRLAARPKLEWTLPGLLRYPGAFDRYYRDHFGLRTSLVHFFNRMRSGIPGLIVGNKVLVGRDGWYFITENRTLDDYRGTIRLSPPEMEKIKEVLEERREWLGLFGIRYLLAIAPAKWEIYPEKVPLMHNRVSGRTVLDQIAAFLKDAGWVELLNLREPLRAMKSSYRVYSLTDTHWNDIGLFVAVQEIKKRLSDWFPGISAESLENYSIKEKRGQAGDLARMMGLDGKITEKQYMLVAEDGRALFSRDPAAEDAFGRLLTVEAPVGSPGKPKAVVFHDSFGRSFPSYLEDSFQRSVYSWRSSLDTRLIIREHPDVVVQELAERDILRTLSRNLPGIAGPSSRLTGKRAQLHCPRDYVLTDFRARALRDLPVRQFISLFCNGEKIMEQPLEPEARKYSVPEHDDVPERKVSAYSFAYRYDPPLPEADEGSRGLPFDLRVEWGSRRRFVGVNGAESTLPGDTNVYFIGPDGRMTQSRGFNNAAPGKPGAALARLIERVKGKKGFLLLCDRRLRGRAPSPLLKAALHSIGLRGYPGDGRPWNSIALIDLGSGKVIAERSGQALQTLVVGSFKTDAGFEVRSLRVSKKSS